MEIIKHGREPERLFFRCPICGCIFSAYLDECETEEVFGEIHCYSPCPERFCKCSKCYEIYSDDKELLEVLKNN